MTSSATRRCFIGLAPDEVTCVQLHERVSAVLDARDWKLHEPEDLHLTLCFLGETPEARLWDLASSLKSELAGLEAPQLVVHGVGLFGDAEAPRVLWAGVSGAAAELERLLVLRRAVVRALENAAITWDFSGAFTPHVTVARPRRRVSLPAGFSALSFKFGWSTREVVLFGSVPGARPHYPRIESSALAKPML